MIKILGILLICIIIESTLISFPLTLVMVILFGTVFEEKGEMIAFLSGLLLDIFAIRPLGLDSMIFLFLIIIWKYFRNRIYPGRIIYRFILLILSEIFYSFFFYRSISLLNIAISIAIALFFLTIVNRFLPKVWEKGKLTV